MTGVDLVTGRRVDDVDELAGPVCCGLMGWVVGAWFVEVLPAFIGVLGVAVTGAFGVSVLIGGLAVVGVCTDGDVGFTADEPMLSCL